MKEIRIDSPLGPVRVIGDRQTIRGVWFVGQKYEPAAVEATTVPAGALAQAGEWLLAYFARSPLPATPQLHDGGTPFQLAVWHALDTIPAGATRSYGQLAKAIGQEQASRAVGAAVGRNPWSILRPCHRVTGADGKLTGYAGGLGRKRALLALETGLSLPWRTVRQSYSTQYHQPISVDSGETVHWQDRPDDGEYPGWKWAQASGERRGWVPRAWFSAGATQSRALRSYSARELDVAVGDRVLELDAFGGWLLVRGTQGTIGWIPADRLEALPT